MKKIKILQFSKVINRNDFIDIIIRYADRDQFEMHAAAWQDDCNIEYHNYPEESIPFYNLKIKVGLIDFIQGAWRLNQILRKHKIDILHAHHYYETIIGCAACLFYPRTKMIFGRHYHDEFYITASGLKLKLYLWVEKMLNNFSSVIIVPSQVIKDLLVKQKVPANKVEVIHYAFDFSKEKYRVLREEDKQQERKLRNWNDKFIVGNFSRHHPIKGQEYLLEAFEKFSVEVPEARLVMVGDGMLSEQLKGRVRDKNLDDKVEFLGWRKDGNFLMNLCDVIVHPTLQEAFPQTMIEVMALKVPIIITPVSGAVDVMKHRVNGSVVPFRSSDAILQELKYLYHHQEEAKKMGNQAKDFVTNTLTIGRIIPQFERTFLKLIH